MEQYVLILIVVDDGLVQTVLHQVPHQDRTVLILVVVDDGLVRRPIVATRAVSQVLILVVVDDGLVHRRTIL